jgi:hypothetical protein
MLKGNCYFITDKSAIERLKGVTIQIPKVLAPEPLGIFGTKNQTNYTPFKSINEQYNEE